jgi:glutamyl-tRNA synthetase
LSKRHGALGVDAYRAMGYLPAALRNYLARLGWSHGDDEIMSTDDMVRWFEIEDVNRGAARFDFQKLEALNAVHMRQMEDGPLLDELIASLPYLPNGADFAARLDEAAKARLLRAMPGLKERARTLIELLDSAAFLVAQRPLSLDEKAAAILDENGKTVLRQVLPDLRNAGDWNAEAVEAAVRVFAEKTGLKLGKVAQPLRAALTGRSTSPGVFDVLDVLGRDESLMRIEDQII